MRMKTLLTILFFIFFSSLIRVPAHAVGHSDGVTIASLLSTGIYEVIHVDRDSENFLTLILHSKKSPRLTYICKIWDYGVPPQNAGCFNIEVLKDRWE